MIIPVWVDEKKDRQLIEWLNSKTNKSATVREILYGYIKGVKIEVNSPEPLDDDFVNSLDKF